MNIIACKECATLFDSDNLGFVDDGHMHKDDGSLDEEVAIWNSDSGSSGWGSNVAFVNCPVCQAKILKE